MRKSIWQNKFDPGAEYEVNKPLRFAGEDFKVGDRFDVKTSERQMRILYDSRFIRRVEPAVVQDIVILAADPEGIADQIKEAVAEGKPKPPELMKKSGGWYDVVGPDGKRLNEKSLRIKDAERVVEEASHDLDVRR